MATACRSSPRRRGEGEDLGGERQLRGEHRVVEDLGLLPRAERPDVEHRVAERGQHGPDPVDHVGRAADHHEQLALGRLVAAAADRSVEHVEAGKVLLQPQAGGGVHRAVDDDHGAVAPWTRGRRRGRAGPRRPRRRRRRRHRGRHRRPRARPGSPPPPPRCPRRARAMRDGGPRAWSGTRRRRCAGPWVRPGCRGRRSRRGACASAFTMPRCRRRGPPGRAGRRGGGPASSRGRRRSGPRAPAAPRR